MNLIPLVDRLESLRLGKKGQTLFVHMMPSDVLDAVLLRGPYQGTKINHELPGYYKGQFQVVVRCTDYDAGDALMKQVMQALTMNDTKVGPQYFNYSRAKFLPVAFPLSTGNLIELTTSFDACYLED